jgi:bacteriorhodopsin
VIEKDKKSYTEKMGKACIVMGTGMILTGAVDYITNSMYGWIFFGISFISGLIIMTFAQLKYNGGII